MRQRIQHNPEAFESATVEPSPSEVLESHTIYILSSPLALTSREEEFQAFDLSGRLFRILTGFSTTHWGLMVDQKCYDLKRHGRWPNFHSSFESSHITTRQERETVDKVSLGKTHFTHSDIYKIGKCLSEQSKDCSCD